LHFENVIFRYRGGKYIFVRAQFVGTRVFETQDLGASGAVNMLQMLGFLEPNFEASWKSKSLEDFK
jgi:hypothetical protein